MTGERKYLYGPVPSRRLGLSLGVDAVPFKVCTLDCVYCQLGKTTTKTVARRDFGPVEPVLTELREALAAGIKTDFITIGGSGEPTLNLRLGELVYGIKQITDIPVALLTNGTLLYRPDVRADCRRVDVALPSLDAADEQTFRRIDCPDPTISIKNVISGLCAFRKEFRGQIWLEVFCVRLVNTNPRQIAYLKEAIDRIKPDKVQLNTAVRPTASPHVIRIVADELEKIAAQIGPICEVVADFSGTGIEQNTSEERESEEKLHSPVIEKMQTLLSMLRRRPCSLDDISTGLSMNRREAAKYLTELQDRGLIKSEGKSGQVFFKTIS